MSYIDMSMCVINHLRNVGFVLVDDFALISYAAAMEPLRISNEIAQRTLYAIRHMPASGARAVSSSGAIVSADTYLGEAVDFDLVFVVAGSVPARSTLRRLEHWLRLLASRGVLVGGISAGSLILARAGIMNGYRLTVSDHYVATLSSLAGEHIIEKELFVFDRMRMSCTGGNAAMSMMLSLIAVHHGGQFADKVSHRLSPGDSCAAEATLVSGLAERYAVANVGVLKALQAMENHLDDPLTLQQISHIVGLSMRQVNRLFRLHLSTPTQAFYIQMRLEKAQQLLRESLLSVGEIALITGFSNSAHFGRHFKRSYAVSPSRYRADSEAS